MAASATIVASAPAARCAPCPSVSTTSPSGTSPLIANSALCSQKMTGSGSRTAAAMSPTTSAGVDGATTLSPGMAIAQFSTLWLCCAPNRRPGPVGGPEHERDRHLAVGHVARLGDLVDDHVPGHREEVGEHQLGDRAQAGHRRAHRRADDRLLADRRVADAIGPELVEQALGQLEHAAGGARRPRRSSTTRRVAAHLLGDAGGDGLPVRQFRHAEPPSVQTWVSRTSAAGSAPRAPRPRRRRPRRASRRRSRRGRRRPRRPPRSLAR